MRNTSGYADIKSRHRDWEFPEFNSLEMAEKQNKYAVCVFVINEGSKIQDQLKKMAVFSDQIDIIVADGGSTDGSLEEAFLKSVNVRSLLIKTGRGKLSAQMRMAFAYTIDQGYEGVVVVDGNGKDGVDAIPDFISLLNAGFDHVQGSRFIPGGQAINTPIERHMAVHFIHAPLVSLASRHRHTDTTNGFRAYSRRLLLDKQIAVFRDIFQTYELHYHLAIESARSTKYKLAETPVTRTYPSSGKTPTKISPIKGNLLVLRILLRAVMGRYRSRDI